MVLWYSTVCKSPLKHLHLYIVVHIVYILKDVSEYPNQIKCLHRHLHFCSACCRICHWIYLFVLILKCFVHFHFTYEYPRFSFVSVCSNFAVVFLSIYFRNGIDSLDAFFIQLLCHCIETNLFSPFCSIRSFVRSFVLFSSSSFSLRCVSSRLFSSVCFFFDGFFFFGSCEYGLRFSLLFQRKFVCLFSFCSFRQFLFSFDSSSI